MFRVLGLAAVLGCSKAPERSEVAIGMDGWILG